MKLQSFDGGVNTKVRPQFLAANQGSVYENIESDVGTLTPVKDLLDTGQTLKPYHTYFNYKDMWVDSDEPRDWLEFQKQLYWTDRQTRPQKFDGVNQYNLGIEPPTDVPGILAVHAAASPTAFTTTPQQGLGGDLNYQDTYYLVILETDWFSKATLVKVDSAVPGTATQSSKDLVAPPYPPVKTPDHEATGRSVLFNGYAGEGTLHIYRMFNYKWKKLGTLVKSGSLQDKVMDLSQAEDLADDVLPSLQGTYQYLMTFYNINDGAESGPSPVSGEVDLEDGGYVRFTELPKTTDPQVTHVRLYRVGGSIASFSLVKEVDITATEFEDKVGDSKLVGDQLLAPYAAPAPLGLSFLCEAYAMLFGAVDEFLRFTPIGKPNDWPELYYIQYDAPITGIAPVANGLLVFTKLKTYIVTGSGPTKLASFLLSSDQGCIAYESVKTIGTEAVWASTDGICRSYGDRPTVMSRPFFGKLSLQPVGSAVYDETYYLLNQDGKMYAFGDSIAKTFDFALQRMTVAKDTLYGFKSGSLYKVFGADTTASMRYLSPRFVEGSFTTRKSYKNIFVYSTGHVIINVLIDGRVVQTKELTSEDNHSIKVPQTLQCGYSIQFEISGTGEVHEIEYEVGAQG